MRLNELSAHEAAARIASGELSSEDLVRACLARIAEREPSIKAFAHVGGGERPSRPRATPTRRCCSRTVRSGRCTACRSP